jgi:hypothetical protein
MRLSQNDIIASSRKWYQKAMIAKGYDMSEVQAKKQDQFIVRFPDGMRDKIKELADQNNRSMNAEIVLALEDWLTKTPKEEMEAQNLRKSAKQMLAERNHIEMRLDEILSRLSEIESRKATEKK